MKTFPVEVKRFPAIRTAGMHVRTTMDDAGRDCPALWRDAFGPRMGSFPADPGQPDVSFGISVMEGEDSPAFVYWAAMPVAEGVAAPDGMDVFVIPGGLYACCDVASLAELGDAYDYMYTNWPRERGGHSPDMSKPSVEVYTREHSQSGKLSIRCPLIEK